MAKTLCLIRRSQNKTSKQHLWLKMAALRIRARSVRFLLQFRRPLSSRLAPRPLS
jgi:hypothetical protein